ncbi:hypothetical protein ACIQYS_14475 [Psychrobacillus sp. NPDC096426]|uniref:hypothetical protein n=1 Tax=Psychrobacillus sp. NPDC096426 TaxID=3364491 RepID=UPI00382B56FD
MTNSQERVISTGQVVEVLSEKRSNQLNETLQLAYTSIELLEKALDSYVTATSNKLHAAQHYGDVQSWADETERFTLDTVKQLNEINERLVDKAKELHEKFPSN